MRILHGPQNIGGMAGVLARAQRLCGIDAYSYCYPTGNFQYSADRFIQSNGSGARAREIMDFFLHEGRSYDGFQFYFGSSFAGLSLADVPILKALGKKVYFYFCGCDVRDSKITIQKYRFSACHHCWPMLCSPNRAKAIEVAERYGDAVFVSTPDLLEFVPGAVLLPQPIDLEMFGPIREQALLRAATRSAADPVRVVHAPSSQAIKGTRFLLDAIESLKNGGAHIELVLVEGKSYAEAMQICASADIVVDQLLVGAYGQYAVEMMALGKPVVCYIREDLLKHYPNELPIVSANIENIAYVLRDLIDDRARWAELERRGLEYVERNHESTAVARKSIENYVR